MNLGCVIPQALQRADPLLFKVLNGIPFEGTEEETDHATRISGDQGAVISQFGKEISRKRKDPVNHVLMEEEGFALGHRNSLFCQSLFHAFIKGLLKQDLSWT